MGEANRKRKAALPGDSSGIYADKLTLDEVAENDLAMVKDAIKDANRYGFGQDKMKAVAFIRQCVDATLKRLDMTSPQPPPNCNSQVARAMFAAKLDKEMRNKGIRIEHRNNYKGSDVWRCGIYIFQRDDLVAFISDIFTERRTETDPLTMKVGRESIGYMVVTNARLDETKRIFLMPGIGPVANPAGQIFH